MFQGYYNLASGMLTQKRVLNVVSNNMTNVITPGYKKDTMVTSTFQDELFSRTGNIDKNNPEELNNVAMIRLASEPITNYSQGGLDETGLPLDFALVEDGFFSIQSEGETLYTRNGSFIVDDEGYLSLPEGGRVLGKNGPILVGGENITVDRTGGVFNNNGVYLDTFALVDIVDKTQIEKVGGNLYRSGQAIPANISVLQNTLERSNVDAASEMVAMMQSQRALQSAAQVLRIYDQLMAKATTEIGRI